MAETRPKRLIAVGALTMLGLIALLVSLSSGGGEVFAQTGTTGPDDPGDGEIREIQTDCDGGAVDASYSFLVIDEDGYATAQAAADDTVKFVEGAVNPEIVPPEGFEKADQDSDQAIFVAEANNGDVEATSLAIQLEDGTWAPTGGSACASESQAEGMVR